MREIFLDENRSVFSQSQEHSVDVSLTAKTRSLPYNNLMGELSAFQLYNNERDASTKFRMIFTVNPVCTNVLFNMKTEVMKDEGSDNCKVWFDGNPQDIGIEESKKTGNSAPVDRYQAIRDTEYSHNELGGLTYHCGLDIFNNHMLRNDGFVHVNKNKGNRRTPEYNTLGDYLRDCDGNEVEEKVGVKYQNLSPTRVHLYQHDSVLSFYEAYINRIKEKNGWYGFTNPGNIDIPNNNGYHINRMLNGNKPCEFIDMYPDRSLYSFIPKYNKHRNRIEKNWNYAITYSYESDKKMVNEINGLEANDPNAIRCLWKRCYDSNGNDTLQCRTLFRHTLSKNDRVRFYYGDAKQRMETSVRVISTGDSEGKNKDRLFSIKYENVALLIDDFKSGLWYRKESNGIECEYYFKKLKKYLKPDGSEPKSNLNKGAFAENIYGDGIAQVVFTDDIDVDGLKDDIGRSVSTLYFTVIKNNAGYEKWYKPNEKNFADDDIEYSHCFGKLTGGLDLGTKEDFEEKDEESGERIWQGIPNDDTDFLRDYNTRYIHNIDNKDSSIKDYWGDEIVTKPKALYGIKEDNKKETGITINDDEFWGDVIEFNPSDFSENTIEKTYYRFNTAQRETNNSKYKSIKYDEIIYDDYDLIGESPAKFKLNEKTYYANGKKEEEQTIGNICPEGYFYYPNMSIMIRDLSETKSVDGIPVKVTDLQFKSYDENQQYSVVDIEGEKIAIDYKFVNEDIVGFYNIKDNSMVWGSVIKVDSKNKATILIDKNSSEMNKVSSNLLPILSEYSVPSYCRYILTTGKLVWRSVVPPSELPNDSDMYGIPFANGCFYIETGFNMFVRRQDPMNAFKLQWGAGAKKNPMKRYYVNGNEPMDMSAVQYILDKYKNICY